MAIWFSFFFSFLIPLSNSSGVLFNRGNSFVCFGAIFMSFVWQNEVCERHEHWTQIEIFCWKMEQKWNEKNTNCSYLHYCELICQLSRWYNFAAQTGICKIVKASGCIHAATTHTHTNTISNCKTFNSVILSTRTLFIQCIFGKRFWLQVVCATITLFATLDLFPSFQFPEKVFLPNTCFLSNVNWCKVFRTTIIKGIFYYFLFSNFNELADKISI